MSSGLSGADIVAVTARHEDFGLEAVEAAGHGVPFPVGNHTRARQRVPAPGKREIPRERQWNSMGAGVVSPEDISPLSDPKAYAERILAAARASQYEALRRHAADAGGPAKSSPDPSRHALTNGYYDDGTGYRPMPLEEAAKAIRRSFDGSVSGDLQLFRRNRTVDILEEFAARLLHDSREGDPAEVYARAISNLLVALSFDDIEETL
jgi:hypothetical protein